MDWRHEFIGVGYASSIFSSALFKGRPNLGIDQVQGLFSPEDLEHLTDERETRAPSGLRGETCRVG